MTGRVDILWRFFFFEKIASKSKSSHRKFLKNKPEYIDPSGH